MTEEQAEFKHERQLPAPDLPVAQKTKKSKKPWTIKAAWKPTARFSKTVYENGKAIEKTGLTLEEYIAEKGWGSFWEKPICLFGNYKKKEHALRAWESSAKGFFGIDKKNADYWLVNKDTGEREKL